MTVAPLISLSIFQNLLFSSNNNYDKFKNEYKVNSKSSCIETSRSSWSLYFIAKAFKNINGYYPTILVPFYFCNSSLSPLKELGVSFEFYELDYKLEPNYHQLAEKVKNKKCDIFILVHFFGFLSDIKNAKKFTLNSNLLFIEDCAHLVKPVEDVGKYSDFQIYSLYKHFVIPDGAFLIISAKQERYISEIKQMILNEEELPKKKQFQWLLKKSIIYVLDKFRLSGIINRRRYDSFDLLYYPNQNYTFKRISSFSLKILDLKILDLTIQKRFQNFDRLKEMKYEFFIKENGIPYLVMLKFKDIQSARIFYNNINKQGTPIVTWPDLMRNNLLPKDILDLRQTTVFFQLHTQGYEC